MFLVVFFLIGLTSFGQFNLPWHTHTHIPSIDTLPNQIKTPFKTVELYTYKKGRKYKTDTTARRYYCDTLIYQNYSSRKGYYRVEKYHYDSNRNFVAYNMGKYYLDSNLYEIQREYIKDSTLYNTKDFRKRGPSYKPYNPYRINKSWAEVVNVDSLNGKELVYSYNPHLSLTAILEFKEEYVLSNKKDDNWGFLHPYDFDCHLNMYRKGDARIYMNDSGFVEVVDFCSDAFFNFEARYYGSDYFKSDSLGKRFLYYSFECDHPNIWDEKYFHSNGKLKCLIFHDVTYIRRKFTKKVNYYYFDKRGRCIGMKLEIGGVIQSSGVCHYINDYEYVYNLYDQNNVWRSKVQVVRIPK